MIPSGGGGSGSVSSISNSDGTLNLSPNPIIGTGTVSLNLGNTNTWTAPINSSYSGTASTPALNLTGALETGGTTTTNVPLFYLNGSINLPTTWSALGTYIGVNGQSGGFGNFFDFHVNGGTSVSFLNTSGTFQTIGSINTSRAGAASTAVINVTGAPFTGGTGITTFPLVYINDGVAPTTWATTGTIVGINTPSTFTGNFFDFRVNGGLSLLSGSSAGAITAAGSLTTAGSVIASVAGGGLQIKSGSNARIGTGTLSGGTLTVANTSVTANTRVFLTDTTSGALTNVGNLAVVTTAGTGFVVTSTNVLDTSTFNWMLVESN